ncbi:uncharacterized protein LOC143617373 [Bidens hawaiensis]|uniref:uncharacterized protein LOC143617373 n=1 Tax=Bidens hawaiensis TaxID=980011 RepID=UPI00404975BB
MVEENSSLNGDFSPSVSDLRFTSRLLSISLLLVPVYVSKSKACCISCVLDKSKAEAVSKAMDDAYTIQISSNLVKQLAADTVIDKVKKKRKPKPKTPKTPQQNQIHEDSQTLKGGHPANGWPPMYLPTPPPTLPVNAEVDAIWSVLQESERVMEKVEKKESEMVTEVTQKAEELHDKEFKLPQPKRMPCWDDLKACLDCYRENIKDTLKCSARVKNFADCARTIRQQFGSSNK